MAQPHGRAAVDAGNPNAFGICDRCGFQYNLKDLRWQFQWVSFRLQNLRILVCQECYDTPQEQLRTILIPPDPVPVMNPRLPSYTSDNNPISTIAISPIIGNGDAFGTFNNLNAAFDGNVNKAARFCAFTNISTLTDNVLGKNWGTVAQPVPSETETMTVNVTSFTIIAPNDSAFLASGATAYAFQGSLDGSTWTTLYSGLTAGTVAESITATPTGGDYQYHRINFEGDNINGIFLAQFQMSATISDIQ